MKIIHQRQTENAICTQGEWTIAGAFAAWILERQGPQFPSDYHRAPAGIYKIELYMSPHFGRLMPRLVDVPNCPYCEIHPGNWPRNSHGCILVGTQRGVNMIYNTQLMFDKLFPVIQAAVNTEGADIEILDIPSGIATEPD